MKSLLKQMIAKYWQWYLLATFLMLINSSFLALAAREFGLLVELGLVAKDSDLTQNHATNFLVLTLLGLIIPWIAKSLLIKAATLSIEFLRSYLFRFIHHIEMSYFDKTPVGRILTRITHDIDSMEKFLAGSFAHFCVEIFNFIFSVGAMLILAPKHGALVVLSFVPNFIWMYFFHDRVGTYFANEAKERSQSNVVLAELVRGLKIIRFFGLYDWAYKKYGVSNDKLLEARLKANAFNSFFYPSSSLMTFLPILWHLGLGGVAVYQGSLTLAIYLAFFQYTQKISNSLNVLIHELQQVYSFYTSLNRVRDFLKAPLEGQREQDTLIPTDKFVGDIKFNNVWMKYSTGDWVLKNLNFHVKAGEKIGILGRTGSGKTTTLNLLSKIYPYQKGEILLDEKNINSIQASWIRDHLGVVTQDVILFKGPLRQNLTLGKDYSDEKIVEAMKLSGLYGILREKGRDLDFYVEDQGDNFSFGEKQLISITRIFLRDPELIIFDEATANIDKNFEKLVHHGMHQLMEGRTGFLIAHRLETLKECDRFFYFSDGVMHEVTWESISVNHLNSNTEQIQ